MSLAQDKRRAARLIALSAALAGATLSASAHGEAADAFPSRSITIVVPYQAGGGADTIGRLLAQKLPQYLNNQTVIVDNRTGATGNIGSGYVARAAPDGYTLLMNNNTITINAALDFTRGYDLQKDLQPITQIASSPVAIGVSSGIDVQDLNGLLKFIRSNTGKVNYSSCGNGSPQHLAAAAFNQQASTDLVHVPYNGCAPAVAAGLGNQVPIVFSTIPNLAPYTANHRMKMIAVTSPKRLSFMPEVPAMAENPQFKDMDITVWFGLFAPSKTPPAIRKRIETAVLKVLADPAFKADLNARYYEVDALGAEPFAKQIATDLSFYSQLVKRANIRLE